MPTTEYGVDQFFQNASGSPKMVYDVAGVLGWSPHNACIQSENLQTSWSFSACTAPTATFLRPDTTPSVIHRAQQVPITGAIGQAWTHSMVVSAGGYSKFGLLDSGTGTCSVSFDLNAGTKLFQEANGSGTITSLGGGQYLVTYTVVIATTSMRAFIYVLPDSYTTGAVTAVAWTPDGVNGINIFRQQTNRGTVATAYLSTTTAARVGLALDYDPVTHAARGLLCEPVATNLLVRSSELDNASWFKSNITIGVNSTTAPDGSTTADKIIDDTTNSNHSTYIGTTLTATAYTFSAYLKAAERSWAALGLFTAAVPYAYFNLTSGTIGTVSGGATASMVSVGNGWYRCSITMTATAATWYSLIFTAPSDGVFSYVGNGTGVYAWGAQLETGTVATSHIPTFVATVTRGGDVYGVAPALINYSATAGSWWVEHYQIGGVGTNPRILAYISAAYLYTTETSVYGISDGTQLTKSGVPTATGNTQRVAFAFQSGDRALTAMGLAAATDTGSTALLLAPGANIILGGSGGTTMRGYFRKLRYVPRRKTNAELVTETT